MAAGTGALLGQLSKLVKTLTLGNGSSAAYFQYVDLSVHGVQKANSIDTSLHLHLFGGLRDAPPRHEIWWYLFSCHELAQ